MSKTPSVTSLGTEIVLQIPISYKQLNNNNYAVLFDKPDGNYRLLPSAEG